MQSLDEGMLVNSFSFSNLFTLVSVVVVLEPLPGTLGSGQWEHLAESSGNNGQEGVGSGNTGQWGMGTMGRRKWAKGKLSSGQ